MICLFSGRYDRPHAGHIIQLQRLGNKYDKVIVPVLDYAEQKYSIQYRVQILKAGINYNEKFKVFACPYHFGKITYSELQTFMDEGNEFDIYCSGNAACLKNMEDLGCDVVYVDRAFDYSASEEFLKH